MTTLPDPAKRERGVRQALARETTKLRNLTVDHNGQVIDSPRVETTGPAPEPIVRRVPAPNAAAGSSANGSPYAMNGDPTLGEAPPPRESGNGGTLLAQFRELRRQDQWQQSQREHAARQQAMADLAARIHYSQRR
jgi:hypothetical protein